MYELNCQTLRQLLEDVSEDTAENEFQETNPYLLENVCTPILHRQSLIPNQIDYSQFTIDDLYDMLDAAQDHCRRRFLLRELNQVLCRQTATRHLRRAFC